MLKNQFQPCHRHCPYLVNIYCRICRGWNSKRWKRLSLDIYRLHALINDDTDVNIPLGCSFLYEIPIKFLQMQENENERARKKEVVMSFLRHQRGNIEVSWKTYSGCGSYLIHQVNFSQFIVYRKWESVSYTILLINSLASLFFISLSLYFSIHPLFLMLWLVEYSDSVPKMGVISN